MGQRQVVEVAEGLVALADGLLADRTNEIAWTVPLSSARADVWVILAKKPVVK